MSKRGISLYQCFHPQTLRGSVSPICMFKKYIYCMVWEGGFFSLQLEVSSPNHSRNNIKYTGGGAQALSFLIKGKPNIEDFIVCFRCVNEWLLVNQISHFKHSELPNSWFPQKIPVQKKKSIRLYIWVVVVVCHSLSSLVGTLRFSRLPLTS